MKRPARNVLVIIGIAGALIYIFTTAFAVVTAR